MYERLPVIEHDQHQQAQRTPLRGMLLRWLPVIAVLTAMLFTPLLLPRWLAPGQRTTFDIYQRILPRVRHSNPVTIVAIDEVAVHRYGQWPWGRDQFARLIQAINAAHPLAIGVDIVFAEADRSSPEQVALHLAPSSTDAQSGNRGAQPQDNLTRALRAQPHHDELLAAALMDSPVVLGATLHNDDLLARRSDATPHNAPHPVRIRGLDPSDRLTSDSLTSYPLTSYPLTTYPLTSYKGTLRSLPTLEAAAAGVAALSSEPDGGVVRQVALLSRVNAALWPALSMDLLRVAAAARALTYSTDEHGVRSVEIAEYMARTDPDGRMWVHFAPYQPERILSAADVLEGKVDPAALNNKLVLVGFYAHGLLDVISTPLGDRRAGVEVHAEVLENVLDRRLIYRPGFALALEAGAALLAALLLIVAVPRLSALLASLLLIGALAACAATGLLAFHVYGVLLDVVNPAIAVTTTFAVMLALTLADTERNRRRLARDLAVQREAQARVQGELAAAQRIQLGLLPKPAIVLANEQRVDVAAFILPARSVGGDLYDFFLLDADHLFVSIGDVSGKGVPASLFMALAKSLTKSSALRDDAALAQVINRAQLEISRDNSEMMFMTLAAFVIDLRDGRGRYVNAGHETPLLVRRGDAHTANVQLLESGGGPPICVLDDYEFTSAHFALRPGDQLLLITDGVTEAQDATGQWYGRDRFEALVQHGIPTPDTTHTTAAELIEALHADVLAFAKGTELPDDIAMVALTWRGPATTPT